MKTELFLFFPILTFLFTGCCEKHKSDLKNCQDLLAQCQEEQCKDSPPTEEGTVFYLTVSLKKKSEIHQTIFVESPQDSSGNTFAIGAQLNYKEFDGEYYKGVKIENLTLRRLSGDSFKINDVEIEKGEGFTSGKEAAKIKVIIEKLKNPGKFKDEFNYNGSIDEIESLSVNGVIQTDVKYKGKYNWRVRICESFIANGSDN